MLRGYRLLVAAACGLTLFVALGTGAFFGALNAPHYGYQSAHPGNRTPQAEEGNPSQIDRDRAGLPYFAERIASGPEPDEGTEREKRDLAAQEASALWAFWMMLVSGVSVVVTSIGTGLLLWQIILTREAVEDTGKATEAMGEANAIARDIGQAQTRAYLSIESLEVKKVTGGLEFKATIRNSGNSPALAAQIMLDIVDDDGSIIKVMPGQEHHVAPQSVGEFAYCYLKSDTIPKEAAIVIFATVGYADVFGSLDKTITPFADLTETWNTEAFTPITAGMHVASYIRSMSPE